MIWKWGKGEGISYENVFKKLHERRVKYLLIGGVAVNLHGIPRATGDLDMLLAMDQENVHKFVSIAKELGLIPKVPVKPEDLGDPQKVKEWKESKNMRVFSFMHPDNPYICIDIMTENYLPFEDAYNRKTTVNAWGVDVAVASIDDLIKLKKIAGRPQDLMDIELLERTRKGK